MSLEQVAHSCVFKNQEASGGFSSNLAEFEKYLLCVLLIGIQVCIGFMFEIAYAVLIKLYEAAGRTKRMSSDGRIDLKRNIAV